MNNFNTKEWFIDLLKKSIAKMNVDIIAVLSSNEGATVTVTNGVESYNGTIKDGKFICRVSSTGTYNITCGSNSGIIDVDKIVTGLVRKIEL